MKIEEKRLEWEKQFRYCTDNYIKLEKKERDILVAIFGWYGLKMKDLTSLRSKQLKGMYERIRQKEKELTYS